MKTYSNNVEFKRKIENSVKKISDYVLSTYGPFGKNILITENGQTYMTKDGVTVAKTVTGDDDIENSILSIIKQAADKTVKDAGDGTTTAILFVQEFVKIIESTLVAFSHLPSTEIFKMFESTLKKVCRQIEGMAFDVESKKMLRDVAFMASNGDDNIADLVSDLIDAVGVAGSIQIKQSKSEKTSIKIMEGLKFNSAVASTMLLGDLDEKVLLNDCVVVVSNVKIAYTDDLLRLLADCVENKKSLFFICPDIDERALITIVENVRRNAIRACVVSPAYIGNEKLDVFEDIALVCGTSVSITHELNKTTCGSWGYCKSVEITKNRTTLMDGKASPELMDRAVESLRTLLRDTEDAALVKRLECRIGRLTSTLGVLYVGGATQAEITEKKHRIEDALESCHSAMRKGVVPGGGATLHLLADMNLNNESIKVRTNNDQDDNILKEYVEDRFCDLLRAPAKKLYKDKKCYGMVRYSSPCQIAEVLDLRKNKYVDPITSGLVESVWTLQASLTNSFSVAWVLCNSYGAIVEVKNGNSEE